MTTEARRKKVTIKSLQEKKARGERITSLGVYDSPMAAIADRVGFDLLVNGNAGPMSLFGHRDPTTVRFEEQLILTQAVSRVTEYGMVVGHLPYLSYHTSKAQAIESGGRMIAEGGADAVKCEGNEHTGEYIADMVHAGIPVMGHIGMQASRKHEQSGFGKKGRSAQEAAQIVRGARAFAEAGVFAFIIEQVPAELATYLARTLSVPVIGLVAGSDLDGVYEISGDIVGYSAFRTISNKRLFADVGPIIEDGLNRYFEDSSRGVHPPEDQTLHMDTEEYKRMLEMVE